MVKIKKTLTQQQEFEILKLVLDKFLWLGFVIMAFGLWQLFSLGFERILTSLGIMAIGAVVLIMFMGLLLKEYELVK
ncbi:hypothetical protein GOV04_04090 [Candidatus Woesearchaeota archaeon]|nr:hypothetical protein [Candidatus Woesearchaeota archaeon]